MISPCDKKNLLELLWESLNLKNAWFNFRFLKVLAVLISQNFILVIDNKTHSLCLYHCFHFGSLFTKTWKKYTWVIRKWSRSVSGASLYYNWTLRENKRKVGRARKTWRWNVSAKMEIKGYRWQDVVRLAQNRTR